MTSPVLNPTPPVTGPLPEWLPFRLPANDNVPFKPLKAIEIAEKRWGMQAVAESEGFLSKLLPVGGRILGGIFFYAQFLQFEGDNPHHPLVVVDQPPVGTSVTQWLDEMAEMARIAALIHSLQAAIRFHKKNGNPALAQQAQQELGILFSQLATISNAYPGATRTMQIMNSAAASASADAAPASNADKPEPKENLPGFRNLGGLWCYRPADAMQAGAEALFDPVAPIDPATLVAKTLVVVGGVYVGRKFLLDAPLGVAAALGMNMLLVDKGTRPESVAPENFVWAPVLEHDPAVLATSAASVADVVVRGSHDVAATIVTYNPLLETGITIRDALRAMGFELRGDGAQEFLVANDKRLAREQMAKSFPEIAVPYAAFPNAATDIEGTLIEVRAAFEQLVGGDPTKRVVIKPFIGADKVGVRTNIKTADEAVAVAREIDLQMRAAIQDTDFGQSVSVGSYPGLLMELQLEGPEVDVEVVMGPDSALAFVIGNPRPQSEFPMERGFSLPSPLPDYAQQALVEGALKAMKATGLRTGNYHVEMMWTPDGARVIEINTRMGGGPIFLLTQQAFGLNLMEQGIRGLLGLELVLPEGGARGVVVSRYILPQYTGNVAAIHGVDVASAQPGVTQVAIKHVPGDSVVTPKDGHSDKLGFAVAQADTYDAAREAVLAAMRLFSIDVRRPDGAMETQRGDYGHNGPDYEKLDDGPR